MTVSGNPGDVTGPRWAGGVTNPSEEDELRSELAKALQALGESRAQYGDLEARRAERDREVAARALEDLADEGERFMFGIGEDMPADDEWNIAPRWHEIRRLRQRAAAIRRLTGDET